MKGGGAMQTAPADTALTGSVFFLAPSLWVELTPGWVVAMAGTLPSPPVGTRLFWAVAGGALNVWSLDGEHSLRATPEADQDQGTRGALTATWTKPS